MKETLPLFIGLIVLIVLIIMLAKKIKVAYPVLLVVAGLLISFIPSTPGVDIDPDMIFFIFLPPLLFEAAWSVSIKEMKKWWRIIGSFAFLVVLFTAVSVALIANYFIPYITLPLGFVLGGIVSPPDAVSAGAILKFVKVPKSVDSFLEGESLLNDASSLIIFRFALVAVGTGQFIWSNAILSFGWMLVGGIGIGLLLGWIFMQAHKHLPTDAPSDIIFTLTEPYILYWVGEHLHSSGVLAVVFGGLYLSNHRMQFLSSTSRVRGYNVWESLVYILNGLVFMIIGLELPAIIKGLKANGIPLSTAIWYGVIITGVLIVVRFISSYIALAATYLFRRATYQRMNRPGIWKMPLVLGWTGMRGVVSLAAALAIPATVASGDAFPSRSLIIFITFMVILLTLLLQGLTLPWIIRKARIFEEMVNGEDEEHAYHQLKRELISFSVKTVQDDYSPHLARPLVAQFYKSWQEKMDRTEEELFDPVQHKLYLEILDKQRQFLLEKNKDPDLDEELIRRFLQQIDLEEEKIKTY